MELRYSTAVHAQVEAAPSLRLTASRHSPKSAWWPMRVSAAVEGALASLLLSIVAMAIHGYHPYAEDGGLYVTAILKALHPALYPSWSEFATVQNHYSIFAPLVATLIRVSGLSVAGAVFVLDLLSIWTTIFACWLIAMRCFSSRAACYGAASLLTLWLTIPIAGTSLLLMDPYFTARSISTPFGLFAIAAMLDIVRSIRHQRDTSGRSIAACVGSAILAGAVHPLMAAFVLCCLALLLACAPPRRPIRIAWIAGLCLFAVLVAGCLYFFGPRATPGYLVVERTRDYWFLSNWHWYELCGLIGPLLVMGALARSRAVPKDAGAWLATTCLAAGLTAIAVSLLFVHESSLSFTVARLQVLRIFQIIYTLMIVVVGGAVGERLLGRHMGRWGAMFAVLGGLMLYVQLSTFPASAHLELPWLAPRNGWEQAFDWARDHTPENALFALDANYITLPGEDAQYFRAIAQRSALADVSKDGGLAAIDPQLAGRWMEARAAQSGLDGESDAQRTAALHPFGVNWIVLSAQAHTNFSCPFRNRDAQVCMLGAEKP